jgi:glycosyltransferase involved in cell wall biosynthesis
LPQLHFIIAGDGPMRASITAQADGLPNVELTGWIPRAALLQLLDTIDLLVLPSHVESFGTVALEALARGRSVLASSTCGIMEWPKLAGTVFRIAAGEPLAQAIRRVAAVDSVGRRHMGSLGIQAAREMNRSAIQDWLSVLAGAGRHCGD